MPAKAADDATRTPDSAPGDPDGASNELTPREGEVLELVTQGLTNTAIARRLSVSVHTVKFHLGSIYKKLGVSNRTEATASALLGNGGSRPARDIAEGDGSPVADVDGLLDGLTPLDLPFDRPRKAARGETGRVERQLLLESTTVDGSTNTATLLAAFAAIAARYSGSGPVCIAFSPLHEDGGDVAPIVLDVSTAPSFAALVDAARSRLASANSAGLLRVPGAGDDAPSLTQLRFAHGSGTGVAFETAKDFDLALRVDGDLRASLLFDSDVFTDETAARMLGHLQNVLSAGTAAPDAPPKTLPLLSAEERAQLLVGWNSTRSPYPACRADELISTRAATGPDRRAVVASGSAYTYADLERRANQLAHVLQVMGARPGVLVGICLERSFDMLVALLAVMKSGAAYVPIDPGFPADRQRFMLEDAQVAVLLTEQQLASGLPELPAPCICLDTDDRLASAPETLPPCEATPEDVAYVIYTSGSTGRPKGVQVPHRALVNFLTTMAETPGLGPDDVLVAVTTLSFDIAGLELYLPLVRGGCVVLASRETAGDPERLGALLRESGATVMQATPTTWRMLVDAGWTPPRPLKALCGGEALPQLLAEHLLALELDLWNMYGPTETTIWSTVRHVRADSGPPTIGRPIGNTTVYILDEQLEPVPIGVPGELYIGGDGLAHGYLDRPELTAERFVRHPFDDTPGSRIYRTGDLARYRSDGEIEFLGRLDHQVKVRGFRIELGEVETALARHPGVRAAVATTREDRPGDVRLVGYAVPADGVQSAGELRRFLGESLPAYMVPSSIVFLPDFPLTPNGKIDRKALPAPTFEREPDHRYVAPRTPLEHELVAIWENVLDIRPIGVTDDFFELGATSIVAARLFAAIERKLRRKLPLAPVFRAPTIERLAQLLESGAEERRWTSLVPIQPQGSQAPIFCVHGGAGTVLHLQPLARRLGTDQPFYGLQARGLYGDVAPLRTVEEMAGHYLDELRQLQPEGPYYLAGYCFGGIVAFDMARRLEAEGQAVRLLAMFNAPSPVWIRTFGGIGNQPSRRTRQAAPAEQGPRSVARRVTGVLASREKLGHYAHHYWWRTKRLSYPARFWMSAKFDRPLPEELREEYFLHLSAVAQYEYQPEFYDGKIVMFSGEGLYDDPKLGWSTLAAKVEPHAVPGEHAGNRDAMAEPAVEFVAARLDEHLASIRGTETAVATGDRA